MDCQHSWPLIVIRPHNDEVQFAV